MIKKDKLHVLIIPSWYPEFEGDYVGSFFREQSISLEKNNCKVGVIYPELKSLRGFKSLRFFWKYKYELDNNIQTHRILWSNWFVKSRKLQIRAFCFLGVILFDRYVKKNGKPDIIHCHSIFNAGYLGEIIAKRYKIPFIITEHYSGFYYHDTGLKKYYDDVIRITNSANLCLAVSSEFAQYLKQEIPNNINWGTHNNIVSDEFLNSKMQNNISEEFKFICISRLDKIKNVQLQIKAFYHLNREIKNIRLNIVGVGAERKNLENLVKKLNLDKKITFLGKLSRNDTLNILNQSDVLIHTSNFETFGVIFVESLALGIPVITTDCGGSSDIINKNVGITIPKNDYRSLVNGMKYIYFNIDKYSKTQLRDYCINKFSGTVLSKKLINHYCKILDL